MADEFQLFSPSILIRNICLSVTHHYRDENFNRASLLDSGMIFDMRYQIPRLCSGTWSCIQSQRQAIAIAITRVAIACAYINCQIFETASKGTQGWSVFILRRQMTRTRMIAAAYSKVAATGVVYGNGIYDTSTSFTSRRCLQCCLPYRGCSRKKEKEAEKEWKTKSNQPSGHDETHTSIYRRYFAANLHPDIIPPVLVSCFSYPVPVVCSESHR